VSRSFGRTVGSLAALESAVASFAARAAERARRHELKAGALRLFLGWREEGALAGGDAVVRLAPTNDTTALTRAAKELLGRQFVEGRAYRKAGVVLGAMQSADTTQAEFFDDGRSERRSRLLRAVDGINASLGNETLRYGGERASRAWAPLRERRSPRWTTNWDELPRARA